MLTALRRKAEERVRDLSPSAFSELAVAPQGVSLPSIEGALLPECRGAHIVFVDGHFSRSLSVLPRGLVCLPLEAAALSYGLFLQARFAKSIAEETDPLALLNSARFSGGAFLYVPAGMAFTEPVQVLHVLTGSGLALPRLHVSLGEGASLALVETLQGSGACNGLVDVALGARSQLQWVSVQMGAETDLLNTTLMATVKSEANLKVLHATTGGRLFARVHLLEEQAFALLQGLAMLTHTRQANLHTLVEHVAPSCTSRQHIKSVLQGASKSHFEGKILVRPAAQKTESYQLNNNLLLGEQAVAKSLPNLEIFADDVKASHGATFAELGETELFYLRSRGLSSPEAKLLLTDGFCRELIDEVRIDSVRVQLLEAMHGLHTA